MEIDKDVFASEFNPEMIRIDGFYLYSVGYSIHPLYGVTAGASFQDWLVPLYIAQNSLEAFLNRSVFTGQVKTSRAAGLNLLNVLKSLTLDADRKEPFNHFEAYQISNGVSQFETVMTAEFGLMDIFMVLKKRGYDTTDLIQNGSVLFPDDLAVKVPDAVQDILQATRCLAFELSTAAGFHLHRANEAVLHCYYDAVTSNAPRPTGRNIGDYLSEMNKLGVGDPKVKSCLKDLKDLHRNPLIHPEDSLESVDEAIALLGSIHSVIVHMLKAIPIPETEPEQDIPAQATLPEL